MRWRLISGTLVFALFGPRVIGLIVLPLAALLALAPPPVAARWRWAVVGPLATLGLLVLAPLAPRPLDSVVGAYVVFASAAFVVTTVVLPAGVLTRSTVATAAAALVTVGATLLLRPDVTWNALHLQALHEASDALRFAEHLQPDTADVVAPLANAFGATFPALLVLQTLAGLALAWQWHTQLSAQPLGPPLAAFRQFRFNDAWVWGLVAVLGVWVAPALTELKPAALNVGIVLSVLYCLRGVAIVVAVAGGAGVPTGLLVIGAVVASALAVPLLLIVPGVWTLGVFDTWLEFRRRLAGRPNVM
jgi:predicted membrane protein DUF2232